MLSEKELRLFKHLFEEGDSLFKAMSTVRTRRIGHGYRYDTGKPEIHGVTGRELHAPEGPLKFESETPPVPLTELEEALICWAGCGPNGIIAADLTPNFGQNTFISYAGRTIPSPCNDLAVELFVINDRGTFLYRPGEARSCAVEIQGEEDYHKILGWYRSGLVQLSDKRPDFDWSLMKPGTVASPWQYNWNRPGTTLLIPVYDVAKECLNALMCYMEFSGFMVVDDDTGEPAGMEKWAVPGKLEIPMTQKMLEELLLHADDFQAGALMQNVRLAAESMGLGCWVFGGTSEDLTLGGFPPITKGLGLQFEAFKTGNHYIGIPGVMEGFGLPAPWWKDSDALVDEVIDRKYRKGSFYASEDNWMVKSGGPFKPEVIPTIINHPKMKIPDWVRDCCKSYLRYLMNKYGHFPVHFSPYHCHIQIQLHHVETAFYDKYYTEGYITDRHRSHFDRWHK
jgi:hypothetical protein